MDRDGSNAEKETGDRGHPGRGKGRRHTTDGDRGDGATSERQATERDIAQVTERPRRQECIGDRETRAQERGDSPQNTRELRVVLKTGDGGEKEATQGETGLRGQERETIHTRFSQGTYLETDTGHTETSNRG